MLVKVVTFFLIGIAVLGIFGRIRFPGQKQLQAAKCPNCGKFRIGKGDCSCGHSRKNGKG